MTVAVGELTALTLAWVIERRDGAGLALTSHDRGMSIAGIDHEPAYGLTPNAVQEGKLDEPLAELSCALESGALSSTDLQSGRWDGARASLRAIDWEAERVVTELCRGEIGEVGIEDEKFTVDFRGAERHLSQPVCPTISPTCRATLGDKHCRVDLASRRVRTTVLSASAGRLRLQHLIGDAFLLGSLRWLSGPDCGLSEQIVAIDGEFVQLRQAPPSRSSTGQVVLLTEGCDKGFTTCRERFRNAANFRGEPHLPGGDFLTRYPGT